MNGQPDEERGGGSFLPDFCAGEAVLTLLIFAELFAVFVALAGLGDGGAFFDRFLPLAMLLPWVALLSGGAVCILRKVVGHLSLLAQGAITLVTLILVQVAVVELASLTYALLVPTDQLSGRGHGGQLLQNVGLSAFVSAAALYYFYLVHRWQRTVEAQARAREAALRARIRPHFLFNALNTAAALVRVEPDTAEAVVEDLSDLFRASLSQRDRISLGEEIGFARLYQRLEQTRLGERLEVVWEVDGLPGDLMVPALILQPLLENAVGHGVEPLPGGGKVLIRGSLSDGQVTIRLDNPAPDRTGRPGHGIAMDNIEERLRLVYGMGTSLDAYVEDDRFVVTLVFPEVRMET